MRWDKTYQELKNLLTERVEQGRYKAERVERVLELVRARGNLDELRRILGGLRDAKAQAGGAAEGKAKQ